MKNGDQLIETTTKREMIAAMAMQGLLSNTAIGSNPIGTARSAVDYADALLKQLGE